MQGGPLKISAHDLKIARATRGSSVGSGMSLIDWLAPLFPEQREFVTDPSRQKSAVCGRRAGKTVADVYYCLHDAASGPSRYVGYVADTLKLAKKLMWRPLVRLAKDAYPDCEVSKQDMSVVLPNRSIIQLAGAKDHGEADSLRGWPYNLVILDEVATFNDEVLEYLLNDVLKASLADYRGTLVCNGTPNPSCSGFLYDIDQGDKAASWKHFHWTLLDNERFPQWAGKPNWRELAAGFMQEELAELGLDINDPWIQREYMGRWVRSSDAFILQVDDKRNIYAGDLPQDTQYILGIDLGFKDESAFVLTGFSQKEQRVYHVTDCSHPGMAMGEIIEIARGFVERYGPIRTVVDPASGGMNLVEELRRRYGVSIQCAEKSDKAAYFRLWNADIRAGRYLFLPGSKLLGQAKALQWNKLYTRERENIPCDLADAALYSWREAYHFIPMKVPVLLKSRDDDEYLFEPPTRREVQRVRTNQTVRGRRA